jgi:hypothetical protein
VSIANEPPSDQTEGLSIVVIFCLFFSLALWTTAYRGLYADGSNLLLHVIESRNFFHVSQTRFTSTFMTQLPDVLAIRIGVRSTAALAMLYTAALGIVPVTCYALSAWIARREPLLFCATVVVVMCCLYPLSFLLVGEGNVYMGLFWLGFVILMSGYTRAVAAYDVLLFLLSIAALEVYETSALFSAILAFLTARRAGGSKSEFSQFVLSAASALFVAGALCGLSGILFPRDAANESGFTAGVRNLRENTVYLHLLAIMSLAAMASFVGKRALRLLLAAILFIGILIFVNQQFHPSGQLALGYVIYQRAQVYCTLFAVIAIVFIAALRAPRGMRLKNFHAGILVPPLIAVLTVDTVDTLRWSGFIGQMCRELSAGNSNSHAEFFADSATRRYGVNWTFPTMSVLARSSRSSVMLVEPGYTGWQPFDPGRAPEISAFRVGRTICR